MSAETILIVEDNIIIAFALERMLTRLGYTVLEPVDSGEEAVAVFSARQPDLVLMDVGLAGAMDGILAAEQIRTLAPAPVIYLTGNSHDPRLKQAVCLSKPVVEKELLLLVNRLLHPGQDEMGLRDSV
jgi:CheY-like chemotaxis protein